MGCWPDTSPSDELKDWTKALLSEADRAQYEEIVKGVTSEELIEALSNKESYIQDFAFTPEQDATENIEIFKEEYDDYFAMLLSEVAYKKLMVAQAEERKRTPALAG